MVLSLTPFHSFMSVCFVFHQRTQHHTMLVDEIPSGSALVSYELYPKGQLQDIHHGPNEGA